MNERPRILIVDDDENTCRTLALIFGKKGYETETAATGRDAMEKAQKRFFNVALLDIKLPDMDGIELIAPIRAMHPHAAVIMVTGYASLQTAIQALNGGAAAYISKPLDMQEVLAKVDSVLEKQRLVAAKQRAEDALRESEACMRRVVENMPVMLNAFDERGQIVAWNRECEHVTGHSAEEIIGNPQALKSLYPDTSAIQPLMAMEGTEYADFRDLEVTLTSKDGQLKTVSWMNISQRFPIPGWASWCIGVDITEQVRAEEERVRLVAQLDEQAQELEQILGAVPEGVLLLDAGGKILRANPMAEEYLDDVKVGARLTHLGDRPLSELLTSPPTEGLWHEVKMNTSSGARIFEVIARPVEKGPRPENWVLVVKDATREREIRAQLQQQERLAAVGQLAAGIAHDFNNIMSSIVLYAQMTAQSKDLPEQDLDKMEVIVQQAQHATRLIQQVLDFSRRAVLERSPLDLMPLLKEQIRLLKRTLPEHIQIELNYGADRYTVHADPTRMQQLLTNLAVNARDAMPEGGTLCIGLERITVRSGTMSPLPEMETGEWIQLTVSDNGVGIPPEVLPHIFEPFFSTKEPGLGSGLGLAQVYGIVGQHGGHIGVDTRVGAGTTFAIYLPALDLRPTKPSRPKTVAATRGQGEVILVVEDGDVVRSALVESLRKLNYRTLEAANGEQALTLMEEWADIDHASADIDHASADIGHASADFGRAPEEQIALVLSDVVMPGMGGIALFHALRERGYHVPVILLTGHLIEQKLEALRDEGLCTWLPKPPSLERLAQVVADALHG